MAQTRNTRKTPDSPVAQAQVQAQAKAQDPAAEAPSPEHIQSLYNSVCALLRILTVGERDFAPADGAMKYNGPDFLSLGFIAQNPGCMASEVAAHLDVAATTVTSTLDRLERRGLVLRERPAENRRVVALSLTEAGQALAAQMVAHDMRNMAFMLQVLAPKQRAPFVASMAQIEAVFTQMQLETTQQRAAKPAVRR
jgi:DNA-binding MarR family transcriptional regulator